MRTALVWAEEYWERKDLPLLPEDLGECFDCGKLNKGDKVCLDFNGYYDDEKEPSCEVVDSVVGFKFESIQEYPFQKDGYSYQWVTIKPLWEESEVPYMVKDESFRHNKEQENKNE
jgi:hypothetical protein